MTETLSLIPSHTSVIESHCALDSFSGVILLPLLLYSTNNVTFFTLRYFKVKIVVNEFLPLPSPKKRSRGIFMSFFLGQPIESLCLFEGVQPSVSSRGSEEQSP